MKNIKNVVTPFAHIALASLLILGLTSNFAFAATPDYDEPVVGTAKLTEAEALTIADKAYTGNGSFTDIELEMERGVLVYAVEYTESDGNEVDVKINADSGAIVLIESDKDEPVDDDEGDDEEDGDQVAKMQMLIKLLNQLIDLLRQQNA